MLQSLIGKKFKVKEIMDGEKMLVIELVDDPNSFLLMDEKTYNMFGVPSKFVITEELMEAITIQQKLIADSNIIEDVINVINKKFDEGAEPEFIPWEIDPEVNKKFKNLLNVLDVSEAYLELTIMFILDAVFMTQYAGIQDGE